MINSSLVKNYSERKKALFALSVLCVLWGTTWVAAKEGVRYMPPLQLVAIRQTLAGLLFTGYFISKGMPWPKGREWRPILILGTLNILIPNGLTTWGVKYISAGLAAILAATFPIWMVVIAMFSSKNRTPNKAVQGLLLGFLGICLIFYEHLLDFLNPDFLFGIIISLIGAWSWAFGTIYTKQNAKVFNPYFSLGLQMLISGIVVGVISKSAGMTIPLSEISWQAWTAILYLALIGSIVSFIAYLYALQRLPIEQASIYGYINPVITVLLGAAFFGEKLTVFIIAGGVVTLYGVYLINQALRKPVREDKSASTA
ncbi:MAG TPA: EamA family transporter [Flavitalea sp.]|nr:EamA family transporter [Flavitalea sp.]